MENMSSPSDVNFDTLLNSMNMDALMAYEEEGLFETLQEPFEEMERRIVISSMVQEAVTKGFLKAIEEESGTQLVRKDIEIGTLKDKVKEKDATISDLHKVLGITEAAADNVERSRSKQLWDFLQESQKKWRESEQCVTEKEKELERLATSMASMASFLDHESKRASLLEKQLNDLKEQEAIKSGQISSFQQEIVKLKLDNSRLKRQARLKGLQFDENMERTRGELQQQRLIVETVLQEKKALEMAIEEKSRVFTDLDFDYRMVESELHILNEKVKSMLMVESTLQEDIEAQKLRQANEEQLVLTYVDQQMNTIHAELEQMSATKEVSSWKMGFPIVGEMYTDTSDQTWKADVEALIVQVVMEGWYKELTEVMHKLTFELAWKDDEIFYRDGEMCRLKQTVEELENDYATLMSICLTLFRDQTDSDSTAGIPVHELDRQKLIELSEFLSSREVSGGQEEKYTLDSGFEELAAHQLQQDLRREIVSEVLKQELPSEALSSRKACGVQDRECFIQLELAEQLACQQLQHDLELEIVSEVLLQKYQGAIDMGVDSKSSSISTHGPLEIHEKKICTNFEELEAHLENFLELEACRLERIRTGCSTSIAKCEFKLDKLMKNLADQVNEMKAKITFVQDAIKQQEWKHMFEEDILVLVLQNALAEMHRNLKLEESSHVQDVQVRPWISSEHLKCPMDNRSVSLSSVDVRSKSETKSQKPDCSQQSDCRLGIQDKDKLIAHLKKDIEELRKEKAVIEQKLDEITEELYSLKRQFWKEKEIWVSKLSQPLRKEVEAQVDALSRHSSTALDLEEEFKKLEEARVDALVSGLKKEWEVEKETLANIISQKEVKIELLGVDLAMLKEKENSSSATEAGILAQIADLKIQVDNLSSERLNQDFQFAKCKQEWHSEKESMRREIDKLSENDHNHAVSEAHLSAQIAELETQNKCLSAQIAELEGTAETSRLASLDQQASFLKLKKEYQEEKECLLSVTLEQKDLASKFAALSEQEKNNAKLIEELQTEKVRLTTELSGREQSATYLTEEKESALALAIREKIEEEKQRKVLENQLQVLKLELKDLQYLNDKVNDLQHQLEGIPRRLELNWAEKVGQLLKAFQVFEQNVNETMQEKLNSFDRIKEKLSLFLGDSSRFSPIEAWHKERLHRELTNLQKAEAEVDLLGDEVELLLEVLEEVQAMFDLYAPVLHYYPRMNEVAKIVKQEIQLRIDPKYGV